jgi:seryl-tRNA synthetase
MLDIKYIRENPQKVKKAIVDKQLVGTVDIDKLLALHEKYLALLQKVELKRSLKNTLSDDIAKVDDKKTRDKLISEATVIKEELSEMEEELTAIKTEFDEMMLWVPNVPADDVPLGESEEDNVVARREGQVRQFSFQPKDHLALGENLGIVDVERGVKIGGFRSYFLKNEGLLLEKAILDFALDVIKSKGFDIFEVPVMVRPEYFRGTGYFPWGEDDHYMTQDGQALIGTAEVSLTSYHADEILAEKNLPVKLAGISPCFRREVGSYGKDTKGIFRVHQFKKVEQVVLLPEGEDLSRQWHEKMLGYSEEVLQGLELPYQVVIMCTADMGPGQRKKYDLETWFPAQETYRETHSDSYFLDFQARRLNMRYRTKEGEVKFVNTLNNTVAASPRLLAAVLENHQNRDGTITIPNALRKYTGFEKIAF